MSTRVRFSQEQPGITYLPASSSATPFLSEILSKPMPRIHRDDEYTMDVFTAASIGAVEFLKEMANIKSPALKSKNLSGWTPLMYAAHLGHKSNAVVLLDYGVEVDDQNNKGQTALMMATACGNTDIMHLLLNKGAKVKMFDSNKRTALHYAANCSQHMAADILLSAGADPNAPDVMGNTPVHESAATGHELTFSNLLERGADVDVKNHRGEDAAALAYEHGKILQMIKDHRKEQNARKEAPTQSESAAKFPRSLSELLEEMDLSRYSEQFKNENIDLNVFFDLKKEDFDDMKIAYGPKKRMMDVIERYKTTGVIRTDAFPAAANMDYGIKSENSSELAAQYLSSLQTVAGINDKNKNYAISALQHLSAGNLEKTRLLLMNIIEGIDRTTAQISAHGV
ncbi:unnamed protein product [Caenorhabditis bovis]|uniref:SAM domain-containing protein n=1 Tax=Caenorhabditis bovis TaxID=2654633 RepID=A0A8S1F6Z8_9PELO|nr:unnamed protein product [Caenorhabditis bovis]